MSLSCISHESREAEEAYNEIAHDQGSEYSAGGDEEVAAPYHAAVHQQYGSIPDEKQPGSEQ